MSDVETLRRAAALMRERAKGARTGDGEWSVETSCYCDLYDDDVECSHIPVRWALRVPGGPAPVLSFEAGELHRASFAEHIASWHPAVALAVAELLDHEAEACGLNRSPFLDETHRLAHTLARAYLGDAS